MGDDKLLFTKSWLKERGTNEWARSYKRIVEVNGTRGYRLATEDDLESLNDAVNKKLRHQQLKSELSNINWGNVSLEKLEFIKEFLDD